MNIDVNSDMQISAKYAVKAALEKYGLALNYSEESLQALETILIQANQQFSGLSKESKLSEPSVQAIARMWGSYLGEVTRRKCGGIWVKNNGDLILTINGQNFYPIEIVYQYITNYTKSSIIEYFLDINRRFNCTKVGKTSEKSSTYPYIITAIILGIILIITLLLFGLDSSNNSTPIPPKYIRVTEENFGVCPQRLLDSQGKLPSAG